MEKAKPSLNTRLTFRRPIRSAPGFRKTPVGLFALCGILLHPHLGQGTFASQSPITCPKRRQSLTLDEIKIELIGKILTLFIKYE